MAKRLIAIKASEAPVRPRAAGFPPGLAVKLEGREKRPLGDFFGLGNFGVNLTRLAPGAASSMRHAHSRQDEFVHALEGRPVLVTEVGETQLSPGMCAGFPAGTDDAHRLVNRTAEDVLVLEIGDRTALDRVTYPEDDLIGEADEAGRFHYRRKDGTAI